MLIRVRWGAGNSWSISPIQLGASDPLVDPGLGKSMFGCAGMKCKL